MLAALMCSIFLLELAMCVSQKTVHHAGNQKKNIYIIHYIYFEIRIHLSPRRC